MIGSMGLQLELLHQRAQLGFWIGLPYWNQGYCTEAGREVIAFGFNQLRLNRIYATHFGTNPASGRVLKKLGMVHEGTPEATLHPIRSTRGRRNVWDDEELLSITRLAQFIRV